MKASASSGCFSAVENIISVWICYFLFLPEFVFLPLFTHSLVALTTQLLYVEAAETERDKLQIEGGWLTAAKHYRNIKPLSQRCKNKTQTLACQGSISL